ncbi:MAG: hypothetical protein KF724_12440 [Phycisphaeraceae bacterium]|nr:hypothetical protein [Phycisphaeraceae bacterium]
MPKTNATAAEALASHQNDIARLIDVLQMELTKHAERAKAAPNNWGFPGNLGKVRSDLIDTVAFISGMGREAVEGFLDDAI